MIFKNLLNRSFIVPVPALLSITLLMGIVIAKAFILEDAFIVFRSIRNFHDGFFLSAIGDVRSQSFTSNLWTLLLLLGGFISHDLPNIAVILSLILTLASAILLTMFFAGRSKPWVGPLLIILLAASTAFTDYSTGGLENPLAHFLLASFFVYLFSRESEEADFFILSFIAGLVVFNRYDHLLIVLPSLVWSFWRRGTTRQDMGLGLLGFIPLGLWMGFAWFYYGSAFPDTYHAKINTGVTVLERMNFAVFHHLRLLDLDFAGMIMLLGVMGGGAWQIARAGWVALRHRRVFMTDETHIRILAMISGVILYNCYFFEAGGDYMAGRFASVMMLVAIFALALIVEQGLIDQQLLKKTFRIVLVLCVIKVFIPHLFVPGFEAKSDDRIVRAMTFDQRLFAENWYFLQQDHKKKDWRRVGFERGIEADKHPYPSVIPHKSAGIIPYYSGPRSYIIDLLGLSDPLLARLPCSVLGAAAHCERKLPDGYQHFVETGDLSGMDPDLAHYTDALFRIKTMPLFDPLRIRILIAFTLGRFEESRAAYITKHADTYYRPGSSAKMFRHGYGETFLAPVLGLREDEHYVHPMW